MDYFNDRNQWKGRLILADQQTHKSHHRDHVYPTNVEPRVEFLGSARPSIHYGNPVVYISAEFFDISSAWISIHNDKSNASALQIYPTR